MLANRSRVKRIRFVRRLLGKGLNLKYLLLVFSLFLLIVVPGHGEMYKWVDEKGTIHFADDLSNVPEKYRSEAEKRTSPRESLKPEVKEKPAPLPEVSQTRKPKGLRFRSSGDMNCG